MATRPSNVWLWTSSSTSPGAGRTLTFLHVTDEFTRKSRCDLVACSIDVDAMAAVPDRTAGLDNGPRLVTHALWDWYRFQRQDELHRARVLLGRTPGSSPTALESETSCPPSSSSTLWSRPKSLSPIGKRRTTPIVRTRRSTCSPLPISTSNGGRNSLCSRHRWPISGVRSPAPRAYWTQSLGLLVSAPRSSAPLACGQALA
jgi:hypothetical protein